MTFALTPIRFLHGPWLCQNVTTIKVLIQCLQKTWCMFKNTNSDVDVNFLMPSLIIFATKENALSSPNLSSKIAVYINFSENKLTPNNTNRKDVSGSKLAFLQTSLSFLSANVLFYNYKTNLSWF